LPKVGSYPANQNLIIKKGFHHAVFEINVVNAKIKGAFSWSFYRYGNAPINVKPLGGGGRA